MELDTDAAVSIVSDATRRRIFPDVQLPSSIILKTYTEQKMKVTMCMSNMAHNQPWPLVLVIVNGNGPSLFGPETGLNTSNTVHVNHNAHPKFYKPIDQ